MLLVLQFITPVFEKLPFNAMGAIVLSSVLGLFELSEAMFLYKANFLDFLVWLAAFVGTIFLGVEIGLGIAIGLAIMLVVYQSAFPHTAVLGRLPETRALPLLPHVWAVHLLCVVHAFGVLGTGSVLGRLPQTRAPPLSHVWAVHVFGACVWCVGHQVCSRPPAGVACAASNAYNEGI